MVMKLRYYAVKLSFLAALLGFFVTPSHAQFDDISSILQSSKEDANLLASSYLKPFGSGFGASLNTGWTNAAKPHGMLGFDLTISTGLAVVPQADKSFDVTQLGLTELEYETGPEVTPTLNGEKTSGSTLAAYEDVPDLGKVKLIEFTMPEGTNFGYVPAPLIKVGVGVIKDTELMVRYMPEYSLRDWGSISLFGAGFKHSINQWIPGGALLPVNLTFMAGYTSMEIGSGFNIHPDDVIRDQSLTTNNYPDETWEGQGISFDTNAWTVNALVGKSLPVISVYGGIGYEVSNLNISTPGAYPTVVPNEQYNPYVTNSGDPFVVDAVEKPIDMDIEGENNFRALAGFRMRFTIFHVSGSYTLSNYSSYNLGFGISFR
jgi:hypothetical protein